MWPNRRVVELVTDDLKLAKPPLDLGAQVACRTAVLEALKLRTEVMTEIARRERENPLLRDSPFDLDRLDEGGPFGGRPVPGGGSPRSGGPTASASAIPDLPPEQPLGDVAGDFSGGSPPVATADAVSPAAPEPWSSSAPSSPAGEIARSVTRSRGAAAAASRAEPARTPSLEDALADEFPDFNGPAAGKKR